MGVKKAKNKPESVSLAERIQQQKSALIDALWANKGIITKACAAVQLDRGTYYTYWNNDPEFRAQAAEAQEIALDHVEGKLHELIDGVTVTGIGPDGPTVYQKEPNVTATIFYLKTKGKKRGYVEKTEQEIKTEITQTPAQVWPDWLIKCRTLGMTNEEIINDAYQIPDFDDEIRGKIERVLGEPKRLN